MASGGGSGFRGAMRRARAVAWAALALASAAQAARPHSPPQPRAAPAIEVLAAQSPEPPPGAPTAAVYVSVRNRGGQPEQLLGATTPVAGMVMIHDERMEGGVMRMQAAAAVPIAAGATLAMHAGGMHVMLMDLKRPLRAGERFPLVLRFARAGEVRAEVRVLPLGSRP